MVARPSDGHPLVLGGTTALVWSWLSANKTVADLERQLGCTVTDSTSGERTRAIERIVEALDNEGLVVQGD